MLETLIGAAVGVALLYIFYSAVRTEWPVNYASTVGDFGLVINRDLWRYLLFTLGPAYIVALLIGKTVDRAGGSGIWTGTLIAAVHVGRTLLVHVWKTARSDTSPAKFPTIMLDCAVGILMIGAGVLGGLGPGPYDFIVPDKQDFFSALWGTVLVVTVGIVIREKTTRTFDEGVLTQRSKREVGADLLTLAEVEAVNHACEPLIAKAVLLTENLQRPAWFRRLERWKGKIPFFRAGSYGVMQVQSSAPVSDEESVRQGVSQLSGAQIDRSSYEAKDRSIRRAFERYNTNPYFLDLADKVFRTIEYEELGDEAFAVGNSGSSAPGTNPNPPAIPTQGGRQDDNELAARAEAATLVARNMVLVIAALGSLSEDQLRALGNMLELHVPRPPTA